MQTNKKQEEGEILYRKVSGKERLPEKEDLYIAHIICNCNDKECKDEDWTKIRFENGRFVYDSKTEIISDWLEELPASNSSKQEGMSMDRDELLRWISTNSIPEIVHGFETKNKIIDVSELKEKILSFSQPSPSKLDELKEWANENSMTILSDDEITKHDYVLLSDLLQQITSLQHPKPNEVKP